MQAVDLSEELSGLARLECRPQRVGRHSQHLSSEDVAAIAFHRLDFLLRFGFGILRGDVLSAARYGVWSFHHGDEMRYRGGPPCFWEIARGEPITGAILQRLTQRLDAGVVLRKGHLRTIDYSYARNVDQLFFETARWPAYVANEIRSGNTGVAHADASASSAPIFRAPSDRQMLRFLFVLARNAWSRFVRRGLREEWNVGIARVSPNDVVTGKPLSSVTWAPRMHRRWLADPMAVAVNGHVEVLAEEMDVATWRGRIATLRFDGSAWSAPATVLDTNTHASYPYVFAREGNVFCIPETFEANAVRLYRARDFPRAWEYVATLIEGLPAVDSTLFDYGGRLWIFCTTQDASAARLMAFHSDALLGPWQAHRRNPIKIDVRSARPAGAPFWVDGAFYRPAQDCSHTYGGRVAINRVLSLSPTEFLEETVAHVEPDASSDYRHGLHTISFAGRYCVIDGKRWSRR